ncbi:hypothetical protein J6590_031841 [Homalodisca vitripennis]|nr:hypothetical protein J6590_031841 [Homalodisca vitripennis]
MILMITVVVSPSFNPSMAEACALTLSETEWSRPLKVVRAPLPYTGATQSKSTRGQKVWRQQTWKWVDGYRLGVRETTGASSRHARQMSPSRGKMAALAPDWSVPRGRGQDR